MSTFGCTVPIVLRPQNDGKKYKSIGDCCVHEKPVESMVDLLDQALKSSAGLRKFDIGYFPVSGFVWMSSKNQGASSHGRRALAMDRKSDTNL